MSLLTSVLFGPRPLDLPDELAGVLRAIELNRVGHENRGLARRKCGVVNDMCVNARRRHA